jgi:hypothetical protein
MYRFDIKYRSMFPWPTTPVMSGTAAVGNRVFVTNFNDTNSGDKLSKIHIQGHTTPNMYRCEAII